MRHQIDTCVLYRPGENSVTSLPWVGDDGGMIEIHSLMTFDPLWVRVVRGCSMSALMHQRYNQRARFLSSFLQFAILFRGALP